MLLTVPKYRADQKRRSISFIKTITVSNQLLFKEHVQIYIINILPVNVNMEAIILKLLVPDGNIIKQSTAELTDILKTPDGVSQLCNCLVHSQNIQVRKSYEEGEILKFCRSCSFKLGLYGLPLAIRVA